MKLAVAIASEDAPPSAFVVWRGFEKSIRKASEYGYHGVELALKSAADVDPEHLRQWLDKYEMQISCISTGQIFATLGVYFTHPEPQVRRRAVEIFDGLIRLAGEFGGLINVGRTRGFVAPGQAREAAEALFAETARQVCAHARERGVTILLEPVNRYEINFINNLDEGAALIARLGIPNLALMPDVFHMNIEDDRISASLVRNASHVRYIHLADSNRLAPGRGHLDFGEVFDSLKLIGFDGWASVEILPLPDPDSAAAEAARFLLPALARFNLTKSPEPHAAPHRQPPAAERQRS